MLRNLGVNKPFFGTNFKSNGSKLVLSMVAMVMLFTFVFPARALAADIDLRDAIWTQSWVPAEFINSLPLAKEKPRRVTYVTVTAYSSTPDQTDDTPFIAASGKRVHDGMVAANFLRFGTKVRFPDYFDDKDFIIEDRMHERFSNRMDVWMETREEALQFGIRRLKVEIY